MKLFDIYSTVIAESVQKLEEVTEPFDLSVIEVDIRKMYTAIKFSLGTGPMEMEGMSNAVKGIKKVVPNILNKLNVQVNKRSDPRPGFLVYKKDKDFSMETIYIEAYASALAHQPLIVEGGLRPKSRTGRPLMVLRFVFKKGEEFTTTYNDFKGQVMSAIQHELIHLGQNMSYRYASEVAKNNYDSTASGRGDYYSHHMEVNSHAADIIQSFLSNGYTKEEAIEVVKDLGSLREDPNSSEYTVSLEKELMGKPSAVREKIMAKYRKLLGMYVDKMYKE